MTDWTSEQLHVVEITDEVQVTPLAAEGTPRTSGRAVTIWAVRIADTIYIRSARGPQRSWFTRAATSGAGQFTAGPIEREVTFDVVAPQEAALHAQLDAAYHAKYDRYGPRIVASVVGPVAAQATLRVVPSD